MQTSLRVAFYSVDPPGLTSFHTFDPESFSVITVLSDALVHIDEDGALRPGLATAWQRVSPLAVDFELRQGVRFHNAEPFDADSVVATFHAHQHPTPSACGGGILSTIKRVSKLGPYRVRVETHAPDAMLLRRLFFGQIYPKSVLEAEGRDALGVNPIGTGAYRLARYRHGRELVLQRNPEHYARRATVEEIRLPILRQKEWVDRLAKGELDVVWNLDSHDCIRAQRIPGVLGASHPAAISQWFLLANEGPLADVKVRRALNHAINRRLLVEVSEHGLGLPQGSVCTREQEGFVELEQFRYSPELARRLLAEAGYCQGFSLRGIVSESSTSIYFPIREFLARVGVQLEAEVVPRARWIQTIVGGRLTGQPYQGDFALANVDNPLLHGLFHHSIFLHSQGLFSLTHDDDYDRRLNAALRNVDSPLEAQARLERYAHDQALLLFTVQQRVHAVWREGVEVALPRSGHFDASAFWSLRVCDSAVSEHRRTMPAKPEPPIAELGTLLEGTSHTGTFYLSPSARIDEPTLQQIWTNLTESEQRWRVQNEPMLRELVNAIEARTNLANVLRSTDRVAIVGYSPERRRLFYNQGYERMFGADAPRSVFDLLGAGGSHGWQAMEATIQRTGAWLGPVHIDPAGRPRGAPEKLFLTVSAARDEDNTLTGHTFVFSDFSGEEERIQTAATRRILENVPYGLFMTDPDGRMRSGYSDACRNIFPDAGSTDLAGRDLVDLLRLDARAADHFRAAYMQVIDDVLPTAVTLAQLPQRVTLREQTYSLRGSLVHGDDDEVAGVLFTLVDITPQIAAEREAEHHRATVMILRHRDSFESFVHDFDQQLERWGAASDTTDSQAAIRASLHTAKGVLGQFSLSELAQQIHALEDLTHIDPVAMVGLRQALRASLATHGLQLSDAEPTYSTSEGYLRELEQGLQAASDFDRLRAGVQDAFERLRQKRAADLLGPLAQAAEQLAVRHGKRVRVAVSGADERVPVRYRSVFGRLVHLVRNAIDHGIEDEAERLSRGKDPIGRLAISVTREPAVLRVAIRDDGRGIDRRRVVERAVALGAIDATQAEGLGGDEQLQLIFLDGLTTADTVTDVSGRGVGLAAANAEVEAFGGRVEVESTLGGGTSFKIGLPL